MTEHLDVSIRTIPDLFAMGRFRPAGVQRTFQWEPENFEALLSDVEAVYLDTLEADEAGDDQAISAELNDESVSDPDLLPGSILTPDDLGRPYFLGEVVLKPQPDGVFEIYDGMQRMTTLTILFSVLRDRLKDSHLIGALQNTIAIGNLTPRLQLAEKDQTLANEIQHVGATVREFTEPVRSPIGDRLRQAKSFFRDRLADQDDQQLAALTRFLVTQVYISVLQVKAPSLARQIFVTTNKRGKALTDEDLFLGQLADMADNDDEADIVQTTFNRVRAGLGEQFGEFMEAVTFIESGRHCGGSYVVELSDRLLRGDVKLTTWVANLEKKKLAWDGLEQAVSDPKHDPTGGEFWRLSLLHQKEWKPLALYWFDLYLRRKGNAKGKNDPAATLKRRIDRLHRSFAALLIAGSKSAVQRKMIEKAFGEIREGRDPVTKSLKLAAPQRRAADRRLKLPMTGPNTPRYLLRWFESMQHGQLTTKVCRTIEDASLEHILPREANLDPVWKEAFPDATFRNMATGLIGNFTLLDRATNSDIGRRGFKRKLKEFKKHSGRYAILVDVVSQTEWTPQIVCDRTARLSDAIWAALQLPLKADARQPAPKPRS